MPDLGHYSDVNVLIPDNTADSESLTMGKGLHRVSRPIVNLGAMWLKLDMFTLYNIYPGRDATRISKETVDEAMGFLTEHAWK